MKEDDIEVDDLHPVGDDVGLRAQDRLLLVSTRCPTVDEIDDPMNEKADEHVSLTLMDDGHREERQGGEKAK